MFTLLSRPKPTTLAERFAWNIHALREIVAMRATKGVFAALAGPAHAIPFARLVCLRFGRILNRFNILLEKLHNNIPPPKPRPSRAKPRPAEPAIPPTPTAPNTARKAALPRRLGWLPGLVPEILGVAGNLRLILAESEMEALIAADPRFGRILRPLCNLLGCKPPPSLRLPKPTPQPRKPKPRLAPRKHPLIRDTLAPPRPTATKPNRRTHPRAPPSWL